MSRKGDDDTWINDGHLDPESSPDFKAGDKISKGDYLGRIANPSSGNTTGPHDHKEKYARDSNGKFTVRVDPGEENPLGDKGRETATYPNYDDGSYHGGRDFAPKSEFKVNK